MIIRMCRAGLMLNVYLIRTNRNVGKDTVMVRNGWLLDILNPKSVENIVEIICIEKSYK